MAKSKHICAAIMRSGSRCSAKANGDSDYCKRHEKIVTPENVIASPNFGKMMITAMSGIIRDIVRAEVRNLIVQPKD